MAFSLLTHASGQANGASATLDTTNATLLVATLSRFSVGGIGDTAGNSWSTIGGAGGDPTVELWYVVNPTTSSSDTITNGDSFYAISVVCFSGTVAASPVDNSELGGPTQPGSMTPSVANCVWITNIGGNFFGAVPTADTPFTTESQQDHQPSGYSSGIAWDIQTTATARNPTWSNSGQVFGIIFKPGAGGGGGSTAGNSNQFLMLMGSGT